MPDIRIPHMTTARTTASAGASGNGLEASPDAGSAPLLVSFKARVDTGYFGAVRLYFGDGTSELAFRPGGDHGTVTIDHSYKAAGSYVATLVAYGEGQQIT